MSRAAIISVGLCLGALPAHAQGVPTQDNSAIGRAIARVTALAEDLGVQQDKDRTESTLSEVQADQLRVLEEMTAAITGPGFDIRALEGNADFGVAAVYPPGSVIADTAIDLIDKLNQRLGYAQKPKG